MVLDAVGDEIDVVHIEGDAGGTEGPLFSPALFRRVFKPMLARWVSAIKAKTKAPVFIHSCGSIYWVIPDFIECGIDILNPVQLNASDMDTPRLKREFGRDVSFWGGGCDTVVLQRGTPQEVADEVKRRIDDLAPGGGFVFGSVHNIPPDVPPENIVTMFDTARQLGVY
jgi:uroporphyrinogen decarboxylase